VILGSGPIRIGQGVEFDYSAVHAVWALKDAGYETIMMNSNPETVSTDYDTADRLYFEPLTFEDTLNLIEREAPLGAIVTLGGQTPLKLARPLKAAGARLLGTDPDAIHAAEEREAFNRLVQRLGIPQPRGAVAGDPKEALALARELGYPLMVRPSYVLGGRAMAVVRDEAELKSYLDEVYAKLAETPVHLGEEVLERVRDYTRKLALAIGVRGLLNVQYAVKDGVVYVLEANPRASRTVPFVSKAIGHPLAKYAALIAVGRTLEDLGFTEDPTPSLYAAKEVVIPWIKFPGVIPWLGPEMRSTGESMGLDEDPYLAYYKAELGAGQVLPLSGVVPHPLEDLLAQVHRRQDHRRVAGVDAGACRTGTRAPPSAKRRRPGFLLRLRLCLGGRASAPVHPAEVRLDAGGLAAALAEVVELGPAHPTAEGDLDLVNQRGVHGEDPLHPHAVGDLAHGEARVQAVPLDLDHRALEGLEPGAVPLLHLVDDPDRVPRSELGEVGPVVGFFDHLE